MSMGANRPPYGSNEQYLPMLKKNLGIEDQGSTTVIVPTSTPIDRPTLGGANSSKYGHTTGATAVTVVESPNDNTYRVVYMATLCNTTASTVAAQFQVQTAVSTCVVAIEIALEAYSEMLRNWQGGLVLLPGQSLEVVLGGAGIVPWSAHWADPST